MKINKPSKLDISIGSFGPNCYQLSYEKKELHYTAGNLILRRGPDGLPIHKIISASQKDWDEFYRELDELGVWNWQSCYDYEICDGTQWEIQIRWGEKRCRLEGCNNYPRKDGTPADSENPTPTFTRFLAAVSRLADGEKFE